MTGAAAAAVRATMKTFRLRAVTGPARLLTLSVALAGALFVTLGAPRADAQPVPACALAAPATPFIGESFTTTVTVSNTGSGSGFVPAAEVFTPAGVTISSATALGTTLTVTKVGTCPASGDPHQPAHAGGGVVHGGRHLLFHPLPAQQPDARIGRRPDEHHDGTGLTSDGDHRDAALASRDLRVRLRHGCVEQPLDGPAAAQFPGDGEHHPVGGHAGHDRRRDGDRPELAGGL